MALQYSVAVNNARLDAIESTIGTSAKLRIYTGSAPANAAAAATGTLLIEIALPSDWMAAASSASKSKAGTWSGAASGETVATSTWDTGGLTSSFPQNTGTITSVIVEGGIAGNSYKLINTITTSVGRKDSRTIRISCKNR